LGTVQDTIERVLPLMAVDLLQQSAELGTSNRALRVVDPIASRLNSGKNRTRRREDQAAIL